jgi:hypothetical protein
LPRPVTAKSFLPSRSLRFRLTGSLALVAPHAFGKTPPLLVTRDLESRARIAMLAAGPPLLVPPLSSAATLGSARVLGRGPEPSPREPHHHRIGMLALQLLEGRDEVVAVLRAESRGLAFNDDRPVGETWGHGELTLPRVPRLPTLNSTGG